MTSIVPDGCEHWRTMDAGPPSPGLSLDACLQTIVEGYLLNDLKSMAEEIISKEFGAVCYPMLMAVLAGSELLGCLTGGRKGKEVHDYWAGFMSRINPDYADLGELAQQIMRHGLMHTYVTKPGVEVVRDIAAAHLTTHDGVLVVDCCVLSDDFRQSYLQHAKGFIMSNRQAAEQGVAVIQREATKQQAMRALEAIDLAQFPPTTRGVDVDGVSGTHAVTRGSAYPG